jgi:hypothetical protein
MKGIHIGTALLSLAPVALAAQGPVRVANLQVSEPAIIAELDMDKLKGQPFRLAWSPDGSQLYVQTLEGSFADANAGKPTARLRHYLFASTGGASKKDLQGPPDWFAAYWTAKYGQHAPGAPALSIDVKSEQRRQTTTSAPMGGDMARGGGDAGAGTSAGGGTSAGDVAAAAVNSQTQTVNVMLYKGQRIGEFVNSVIVPGFTYGWGPSGTNVMAFAAPKGGKVVILDDQGKMLEVDGTKDAILPAWSPNGTRLVWLEKDGKKKYRLYLATVAGR